MKHLIVLLASIIFALPALTAYAQDYEPQRKPQYKARDREPQRSPQYEPQREIRSRSRGRDSQQNRGYESQNNEDQEYIDRGYIRQGDNLEDPATGRTYSPGDRLPDGGTYDPDY